MLEQLGTLEELLQDYRDDMRRAGVAPLWPMMRNVLPHGAPNPITKPGHWGHWAYEDVRPLLLRAGELTSVEKAERQVLVLSDPAAAQGAYRGHAGHLFDLYRHAIAATRGNGPCPSSHALGCADHC